MDMITQTQEVAHNFDAFQRRLAAILPEHAGHFALLRSGIIEEFFATPGQAYAAATMRFPDGRFSIQEVTNEPVDLGFFSHVAD